MAVKTTEEAWSSWKLSPLCDTCRCRARSPPQVSYRTTHRTGQTPGYRAWIKAICSPPCLMPCAKWVLVQGVLACLFLWKWKKVLVKEEVGREPLLNHLQDLQHLVSRLLYSSSFELFFDQIISGIELQKLVLPYHVFSH